MSSNTPTTRGVPDSLEFQPGAGGFGVTVYECVVCGERIRGTETAKTHDTCSVARECPRCERTNARPSLDSTYARVDVCQCCGLGYPTRPEGWR